MIIMMNNNQHASGDTAISDTATAPTPAPAAEMQVPTNADGTQHTVHVQGHEHSKQDDDDKEEEEEMHVIIEVPALDGMPLRHDVRMQLMVRHPAQCHKLASMRYARRLQLRAAATLIVSAYALDDKPSANTYLMH